MLSLKRNVLGLVIGGVTLVGVAAPSAWAQAQPGKAAASSAQPEHKKDKSEKHESKGAKVGEQAPAFEAKDQTGKTVKLSDYKGKIVVLEWFNPGCPVVQMHYDNHTFQKLHDQFKGKEIVWLAVNSGGAGKEGAGTEASAKAHKEWKMDEPILIDESGTIGHTYGATNTPMMFVIDAKGNLAYKGAIDDGNPSKPGKTNYVAKALDQLLKGETVSTQEVKAYGCGIKYGKQGA